MSVYTVGNNAAPSIIGYGGLLISALSGLSLLAGGPAILDVPGDRVIDFAAAVVSFFVSGAVLKSRDPTAAWLAASMLVVMIVYAGLNVNMNQAGNMLKAAQNAATYGARSASYAVAHTATTGQQPRQQWATVGNNPGNSKQWVATRELTPQESAACDQQPTPEWRNKPQGIRNCTRQANGRRYIWKWQ